MSRTISEPDPHKNFTPEWRSIRKLWPPKDSIFLLTWDGYWIRANRGNAEYIIAEWLGYKYTWNLNELLDCYWYYVPPTPDQLAQLELARNLDADFISDLSKLGLTK